MAMIMIGHSIQRRLAACFAQGVRFAGLWREDLASFIPVRWSGRLDRALGRRGPFAIEMEASGRFREAGKSEVSLTPEAIRSGARDSLLALRIDEAHLLRRSLSLPLAAAQRLDTALEINLGTWTPFAANDVYAVARPIEQEVAPLSTATQIELRCVVRPLVDKQIAALAAIDLEPDLIELGDPHFSLARTTRKRQRTQRQSWCLTGLAALLIAQCLGIYIVLTGRQDRDIDDLANARATLVTELRRTTDAEKENRIRADSLSKLVVRIDEEHSISRALQLLAEVFPADSVVREFELGRDRAEGHIAIVGPATLDVTSILAKTGIYRVQDVSVLDANEPERKVFSVGFEVVPWLKPDNR